jgi:hypothetical protein
MEGLVEYFVYDPGEYIAAAIHSLPDATIATDNVLETLTSVPGRSKVAIRLP